MPILTRTIALASLLLTFCGHASVARDRTITGVIAKIECGDGTNFDMVRKGGKHITGACFESWCEGLCGENAEAARAKMIGRRISASVRVVNMEEAAHGVLSNEFFNVVLEE